MNLRASTVGLRFDARVVLEDVTLAIEPGRLVAILGPNGAGKSSLLRCLGGLVPHSGVVAYDGTDIARESPRALARLRAYVPQDTVLPLAFVVRDVLAMATAHRSTWFSREPERAHLDTVLSELGCGVDLDAAYDCLSGGERQLVLIARAFLQDTNALLFDEPFSALDLRHQAHVAAALRRRCQDGRTVVCSVHDLNLAAAIADTLVLLSNGRVVGAGPPAEVLTPALLEAVYGVSVDVERDSRGLRLRARLE